MPKIIVIGSANTDMVVKTQKFPAPGETILGGDFFMFSGGKGANQAVAAARMGGDTGFIGNLGQDIFGERAIDLLNKEGINTAFVTLDPHHPSGVALILVDANGENEIVVAGGANNTLTIEQVMPAKTVIADAEILLMQLEIPLPVVIFSAGLGHQLNKKIILNPAPAAELPSELLQYLYLITPNETEAEILTGIKVNNLETASFAADFLLAKGVRNVIITMGAQGAFFKNNQTAFMVDAPIVKSVDTTAAGDVFNGALAVSLCAGNDWPEAISTACKAASISVTRMGAQASMPYREEIS